MSLIKFSSVAVLLLFLALLGNNGFNNNGIAVATKRPHPDEMISWRDHRHIKRTAISERDAFYYGEMAHLHALLRTSRAETAAARAETAAANAALEAALAPILAIPDQANEAAETQVHPVANEVADNEEIVEQVVNPPAAIDHVNFAPDQANEEADVNPVPNEVAENNEQVVNPPADPVANEVAAIAANDNHVAHPAVPGANEEIDAPIIQGQADPVANEVATHPPIAAANQETDAPIIPGQADLAANEVAAIPGQEEPTPILEADQVAAVELVPDPLPAHVNPDNEVAAIPGQAEPAPILEADQVEAPELVHVNPDLHANDLNANGIAAMNNLVPAVIFVTVNFNGADMEDADMEDEDAKPAAIVAPPPAAAPANNNDLDACMEDADGAMAAPAAAAAAAVAPDGDDNEEEDHDEEDRRSKKVKKFEGRLRQNRSAPVKEYEDDDDQSDSSRHARQESWYPSYDQDLQDELWTPSNYRLPGIWGWKWGFTK